MKTVPYDKTRARAGMAALHQRLAAAYAKECPDHPDRAKHEADAKRHSKANA